MAQKIVFLDRSTIIADFRRPGFEHEWTEYETSEPEEVVGRLEGATIVITNKVPLREAALARLPQLKLIAVCATGVDIVDLEAARRLGVAVANVRGYALHSVPEHVMMLMLSLRRSLFGYREDVRRGAWQQATGFCLLTHTVRDLYGSTLGIIGHGALGRAVEKLARGFGMRVLVAEHK